MHAHEGRNGPDCALSLALSNEYWRQIHGLIRSSEALINFFSLRETFSIA